MAMPLALGAGILTFLSELARPNESTPAALRGRRPRQAVRAVCTGCERQRALFRAHGLVTWGPNQALCRKHRRAV